MTDPHHSEELVTRASRGDQGAVDALMERLLPDLAGFLRRRAGPLVLARESGADLAQSVCREVLEQLAERRFEFRGDAEFKQWLFHAAELKLRNRHRFYGRDRRDPGRETPLDPAALAERLAASMRSPSQAAVQREEIDLLQRAFQQLDSESQAIIVQIHVEGLSHAEVAERLRIDPSHSRTRLARAMARLARLAQKS